MRTTLTPTKVYVTEANAVKAVERLYPKAPFRWVVVANAEGKFYPICIGMDAVREMTHFHFVTVA